MAWKPVYEKVKKIPRGKVITYGQLARSLKLRGGARAAGHALAVCPQGQGIPWHRVVGAGGRILLREPHAGLQRRLLESEGVQFAGRAVDLSAHERRPHARAVRRRK
jgi:methylated-DNA-protein-cysteine methyltransferase related protein